jgi:hypothetical protein
MAATRLQVDAVWLEAQLDELGRLVEAGDTLELVARLGQIVRAPVRAGAAEAARALTESA